MRQEPGFETLLETLAGLAAANIVLIETLHEHHVLEKTHFAHAFARALDGLAAEHRGGMVEHVLQSLRDRCMNLEREDAADVKAWLARMLER